MEMKVPNILGMLFGNKKHIELLVNSKKFEIVCINFDDKTLIIRDHLLDKIVEVCFLPNRKCPIHCLHCDKCNCDHAIFTSYSFEVTNLKYLCTVENKVKHICQHQKEHIKCILKTSIIPAVMFVVFSIHLLPIGYLSTDGRWHTMLSQILNLMPFIPVLNT